MQKLMQAATKLELHKIVRIHLPIVLCDLEMGIVIRDIVDGALGVQVFGEAGMRNVSADNIYTENGALMEVLPTYTDDQLYGIYQKLNTLDPDQARTIISYLEQVGFDIEYEDYRTLQDGYVYTFNFNPPQRLAGKLTIKVVSHRPSFCAKFGHEWGDVEMDFTGAVYTTCQHCGERSAYAVGT